MRLESDKAYSSTERDRLFQANLNGGTAYLAVKITGSEKYVKLKDFEEDDMVSVTMPNGAFKVILTGDAIVSVS